MGSWILVLLITITSLICWENPLPNTSFKCQGKSVHISETLGKGSYQQSFIYKSILLQCILCHCSMDLYICSCETLALKVLPYLFSARTFGLGAVSPIEFLDCVTILSIAQIDRIESAEQYVWYILCCNHSWKLDLILVLSYVFYIQRASFKFRISYYCIGS